MERQAAGLRDLLEGLVVRRIVSSPAWRCVQTVTPLVSYLDPPA